MKHSKNFQHLFLSICLGALLVCSPLTLAADDLEDNSTHPAYSGGFVFSGSNGNFGSSNFGAWFFGSTGMPITSVATPVSIGGTFFGLEADSAFRSWSALTADPYVIVEVDYMDLSSGNAGEMTISDGPDTFVTIDVLNPGTISREIQIIDNTSTGTGLDPFFPYRARFIFDSDTTYDLELINLSNGSIFTSTGRTIANGTSGAGVDTIAFGQPGIGDTLAINNLNVFNSAIDYRDNASKGVYSDSWTTSHQDNGNAGGRLNFDRWSQTLGSSSTATIGTAGDIDVDGASFILTRGAAASTTNAERSFTPPTPNPTTIIQFSADMLTGTGGQVHLRGLGATAATVSELFGAWTVTDVTGTYISSFPATDPVLFSFAVDATGTYDLTLNNLTTSSTESSSGRTLMNSVLGNTLDTLHFSLPNNNSSIAFNSLAVDSTGSIPVPVELSAFNVE